MFICNFAANYPKNTPFSEKKEKGYRNPTTYAAHLTMRKQKKGPFGLLNFFTTCISTTMVLILVGTVVFFGTMAENLGRTLRENFTVEVLLNDSITQKQAYALQTKLKRAPYTRMVNYISKEKATRLQAEALQTDPNEFLGYSPIPASFELHLKAEYANTDSLNRFMPPLKAEKMVSDVVYPEDLMNNVNENIQKVSLVLLIIAALLTFVSISLINNTMRLSVSQRKYSIQTMKLVGARWSFIRRPFLWQAFGIGLTASLLADGVLFGGMSAIVRWDAEMVHLITPLVMAITLGSVFIAGIVLTLICAFFSVNQHLGMSREEAYLY